MFLDRIGFGGRSGPEKKMIGFLDTSIGSLNVGDQIICKSAYSILYKVFPEYQNYTVSTHDGISSIGISRINATKYRFVLGTNLLSGRKFSSAQWNYSLYDALRIKPVVTMGVGWSEYSEKTSLYSSMFYKSILDKKIIHSVRDNYTKEKLEAATGYRAINTGCPTTWGLTPEHCSDIKSAKSEAVITTLTDYRRDLIRDKELIRLLLVNYNRVYIWAQGSGDLEYISSLQFPSSVTIIPPRLDLFDEVLRSNNVDYVGTRLHAGIRALQLGVRTIIVALDNRALEMKKDISLPVLSTDAVFSGELENLINNAFELEININISAISDWLDQFRMNA